MKAIISLFYLVFFFSCNSKSDSEIKSAGRNVYDSISHEYCQCFNADTSQSFDSKDKRCKDLCINKYYKQLHVLGYDTTKNDSIEWAGYQIILSEVFVKRLERQCLKYHIESRENGEEFAQENKLPMLFLGTVTAQKELNEKEYEITLREKDFELTRKFLSAKRINIEKWKSNSKYLDIIVEYKIVLIEGKKSYIIKEIIDPYER